MAHALAVTHYTAMAREAAAMRNGQERRETAPPYAGDDDTPSLDVQTDAVIEVIGRACRAIGKDACRDLLREAAAMLETLADEVNAGEVVL